MYLRMVHKKSIVFIALFALSIIIPTSVSVTAFAQNQTETSATLTGQPETGIINQTTIPAEQTNITVEQTTQPVQQQALQPLGNVSSGPAANLTELENKTMLKPTGPAITTTVNATQIPFNQTVLEVENQSQEQQQQQQQQQPNQTQGQQQQDNQSEKGPLEQMGDAISKTFGGN
jgi:hypothetical protein